LQSKACHYRKKKGMLALIQNWSESLLLWASNADIGFSFAAIGRPLGVWFEGCCVSSMAFWIPLA
jgi:hypothetical protein